MTIFNTNPSEGGSGGDYDFFNDAPLGTYGAFPRSLIEGKAKWHTGFSGQIIPTGTYPELDALPDFQVPETTDNLFNAGGSASGTGERGWIYSENNKFYKVKNGSNPLTITESTFDENTDIETETTYLTLTNFINDIEFFAMNDAETEIIAIGRDPSNKMWHYDISTSTLTDLTTVPDSTIRDPDNIMGLHWNQNLGKFIIIHRGASTTVKVAEVTGTTVTQLSTLPSSDGLLFSGNTNRNGTGNYIDGNYFFSTKSKKVYSVNESDLTTINEVYTFPNVTTAYIKSPVTNGKNTIAFMSDFDFTNKIIQMTISFDKGVTWTEQSYTQSSSPSTGTPQSMFVIADDYVTYPHSIDSNSSRWYRQNIKNVASGSIFSNFVSFGSTSGLDKFGSGCIREDGKIFYGTNALAGQIAIFERNFSGGDGLTMPPLEFNEFPDQFIYGLKHTT